MCTAGVHPFACLLLRCNSEAKAEPGTRELHLSDGLAQAPPAHARVHTCFAWRAFLPAALHPISGAQRMKRPALLVAVVLLSYCDAFAADAGVLGDWRGPANSVIRIATCGDALCATVVQPGVVAAALTDSNNPDTRLRRRPICGLQIGEGFHGSDPNKADGGHLYDPRNGKTYKGSMTREGDALLLRGYIGVSMFGRTARWDRIPAAVETCKVDAPATPPQPAPAPQQTTPQTGTPAAAPQPPASPPQAAPAASPQSPAAVPTSGATSRP